MNSKVLNKVLNVTIRPARAAAFLLAVTVMFGVPLFSTASVAVAQQVVTPSAALPDSAGTVTDIVLAQQAKPAKEATKQAAENEDETAQLRQLLKDKTQWIQDLPVLKTLKEVMPQLWTPIRLAGLLLFLVGFVTFHFMRQMRNRLEYERDRNPTAAEAEFRVTVNTDGKEVRP